MIQLHARDAARISNKHKTDYKHKLLKEIEDKIIKAAKKGETDIFAIIEDREAQSVLSFITADLQRSGYITIVYSQGRVADYLRISWGHTTDNVQETKNEKPENIKRKQARFI